ncbi:High mobility group box 1 [Coelomomyces lativittatus]|nr:High mobility group box 1 [Coelomomyces lativittatus]KAJ1504514.1 High mobility group box 1 [Coelomomyces lativittatus]
MPKLKHLDPAAAKAKKKERRAKKANQDPNKPKRASTAFFIFSADYRSKLRAEMPSATVVDISRTLGERWRSLPENEKKVYLSKAELEKVRYQRESNEYKNRQSTLVRQY